MGLKRSRWVALTSVVATIVLLGSCDSGTKIPAFNATPTVTGLYPSNITAGSQDFILAVAGTGFQANFQGVTFVSWNGSPRSTTYNPVTGELTVQIFASDITTANTITITATNPAPGGGISPVNNLSIFTIVQPQAGLTIVPPLSPASAKAAGLGFALTVTGTGFATNDIVTWNGSPRTTVIAPMNTTTATATITADDIATAGSASVAVATPGQVVATPSLNFPITGADNPKPALSTLSPSSATNGGGDFQMRVSGSGFAPSAFVTWNGGFRATAFISSSQLVVLIPASDISAMNAGTKAQVAVTNPAPGGGTSGNLTFTIN
jgi:trimeric autotransporter adhesin